MLNFENGFTAPVSISLADMAQALDACERRLQLQQDTLCTYYPTSHFLSNLQRDLKIIKLYKRKVVCALTSQKLKQLEEPTTSLSLLKHVKAPIYIQKSMDRVIKGWNSVAPILFNQIYQPVPIYNQIEYLNEQKLQDMIQRLYFLQAHEA